MTAMRMIGGLLLALVGLFMVNFPFQIISFAFLGSVQDWLVALGGVFVVWTGIKYAFFNQYAGY
jgi:hypothetical protein